MKLKLDRIISMATLVALVVAISLMLKKPAAVVQGPQTPAGTAGNVQSIDPQPRNQEAAEPAARQAEQTQPASSQAQASRGYAAASSPLPSSVSSPASSPASSSAAQPVQNLPAPQNPKAEPQINSAEVSAAISKMLGGTGAGLAPDSEVGAGTPNIKDQKVTYDGDTVHGQFLTEIAGKDVWITISGHMGQKDGYATFEPTEFKVGNMDVPVSLVNPALQRKLAEERDRLKLSDPAK